MNHNVIFYVHLLFRSYTFHKLSGTVQSCNGLQAKFYFSRGNVRAQMVFRGERFIWVMHKSCNSEQTTIRIIQ